jgi:hypothetical protein
MCGAIVMPRIEEAAMSTTTPADTHEGSVSRERCCGGPPADGADACCARDATAKAHGRTGCGCPGAAAPPVPERRPATCCPAPVELD